MVPVFPVTVGDWTWLDAGTARDSKRRIFYTVVGGAAAFSLPTTSLERWSDPDPEKRKPCRFLLDEGRRCRGIEFALATPPSPRNHERVRLLCGEDLREIAAGRQGRRARRGDPDEWPTADKALAVFKGLTKRVLYYHAGRGAIRTRLEPNREHGFAGRSRAELLRFCPDDIRAVLAGKDSIRLGSGPGKLAAGKSKASRLRAKLVLRQILADGAVRADLVRERAAEHGVRESALRRARVDLRVVVSGKAGRGSLPRWWRLPGTDEPTGQGAAEPMPGAAASQTAGRQQANGSLSDLAPWPVEDKALRAEAQEIKAILLEMRDTTRAGEEAVEAAIPEPGKPGRPAKYPRALEMALRLFANDPDPNPRQIYRLCKEKYGEEEPIPCFDSFMRSVRREAAERREAART
jgi:hypothetical protein